VTAKIIKQPTKLKSTKTTAQQQQQLSIKTTSVYDYSQLEQLKESLSGTQPIILIARIKPIVSKDSQAKPKLVDELYSSHAVKNNNYSIFRLGEERIIVVPSNVQVEELAFHQNQNALISDGDAAQANNDEK
jgi:SepF-like predicted cell division protein (DUF552 family)